MADLISSLEIQRLQLAGSSSTVFAVNLILYYKGNIDNDDDDDDDDGGDDDDNDDIL